MKRATDVIVLGLGAHGSAAMYHLAKRDILRGYAFSAQSYPFVAILRDYSDP